MGRNLFSDLGRGSFPFLPHYILNETVCEHISSQNNKWLPKITTRGAKLRVVTLEKHMRATYTKAHTGSMRQFNKVSAPCSLTSARSLSSLHLHSCLVYPRGESPLRVRPTAWLQSEDTGGAQRTQPLCPAPAI